MSSWQLECTEHRDYGNSQRTRSRNLPTLLERRAAVVLAEWNDSTRSKLSRLGDCQSPRDQRPAGPEPPAHRARALRPAILVEVEGIQELATFRSAPFTSPIVANLPAGTIAERTARPFSLREE